MADKDLRNLVTLECLHVGPPIIKPDSIRAPYTVTGMDGRTETNELVYTYEEKIFKPDDMDFINLASMMVAQVAMNYGLFFKKIVFDGLYDDTDKRFITDMTENTSREIYVNKILKPNVFLLEQARDIPAKLHKRYTAATLEFINTRFGGSHHGWSFREVDRNRHVILSSGGKDSLLTYGLLKEIGKDVHPVYINESGRHWFTAINSYRYFREKEKNTGRVWCNSDRIFNWMLRQMPFIRPDFQNVRADDYPIRLWTVAVFIFGAIPLAIHRRAGRLLIGDEYDTSIKTQYEGITHYNSLYDQSRYFDNAMTRYYFKKGWNISQFSVLRPLSELLIMKILVKRYPELQEQQISCHASHEKKGRIYPCGNCEKCRRIVGMLKALEENPERCGYSPEQVAHCLKELGSKKVKQIGSDASHLYHLLSEKKLIDSQGHMAKSSKAQPQIVKLRFDSERSLFNDIPDDLRKPLYRIYLEYADGAVKMVQREWQDFDLLKSQDIKTPYPFEIMHKHEQSQEQSRYVRKDYLWSSLSWPEIEARLKKVDTAILPCGSIEQHGPHLPVDVDYFDAEYLAIRVAEACSDPRPFVLPAIPYGVSYHHLDFPGTVSITNEGLFRFVYDIGMSLAKNGIKKLIILNGHGDNAPTLNFAAQMINRDAMIFVCVDTGESSDEDIFGLIDTPNDVHAGEIETSTTLALRPKLVRMDQAKDTPPKFGSSYMDFTSARGVPWYVRTKKISESGTMGCPTRATAEKGMQIWEIMTAHLVRFVEEVKNSNLDDLYQKKY